MKLCVWYQAWLWQNVYSTLLVNPELHSAWHKSVTTGRYTPWTLFCSKGWVDI